MNDLSVWQGMASLAPLACSSVGANAMPLQIPKLLSMSRTLSLLHYCTSHSNKGDLSYTCINASSNGECQTEALVTMTNNQSKPSAACKALQTLSCLKLCNHFKSSMIQIHTAVSATITLAGTPQMPRLNK